MKPNTGLLTKTVGLIPRPEFLSHFCLLLIFLERGNLICFLSSWFYLHCSYISKIFFKRESAPDTGSTCASMNLSGNTNAKQGPTVDYNAYKVFHDQEFEAHVLASFMTFAGMNSIEGKIFIFTFCGQLRNV